MIRSRIATISILIFVPLFLTGCSLLPKKKQTGSTATPTPSVELGAAATEGTTAGSEGGSSYLNIDPTSLDATLKESFNLAESKSKLWRQDAQLVHYSVKIPNGFTIGTITETYSYGSTADPFNWWTITISAKNNKVVRALIPKEDYLGTNYGPIPQRFWKINFIEALQLAEINGGSDYRKGKANVEATATLAISEPKNYLWWAIEYRSSTGDPYKLLINPSTKEVVTDTGTPLSGVTSPASADSVVAPAEVMVSPEPQIIETSPDPQTELEE